MSNPLSADALTIRSLIEGFIAERRDAKLEKLSPDDERYPKIVEQFEREAWLEDAARRVCQLQVVTHVLKGIHPDAKGTNLFVRPEELPTTNALGSHACQGQFSDVTGNAAALDVYKFLKLEHQECSLLDRLSRQCPDTLAALSDSAVIAKEWAASFAAITVAKGTPASHVCAKQMYWLKGLNASCNDDYILLAPLFPSSLVHDVFQKIQHDRFSEEAKEARKAQKADKPSDNEVHRYPEMAIRKLGGTKPQNISQLNSERGGNNILLSGLPPQWNASHTRPILNTSSAFGQLCQQRGFYRPLNELRKFLHSDPTANIATRRKVRRLIERAMDSVIDFTMKMHELPPGWSAINTLLEDGTTQRCEIPNHEKHWLDPFRAATDAAFRHERQHSHWQEELRQNIAREINRVLNRGSNSLGASDTEIQEWKHRALQHASLRSMDSINADYMRELDKQLDETIAFLGDEEEGLA